MEKFNTLLKILKVESYGGNIYKSEHPKNGSIRDFKIKANIIIRPITTTLKIFRLDFMLLNNNIKDEINPIQNNVTLTTGTKLY